jgi:peptide/nickel transport system substrate-binding protein
MTPAVRRPKDGPLLTHETTRRTFLGGFAAAGGLLLLTACGGGSGDSSSPASSGAAVSDAALAAGTLTTLRAAWTSEDLPFDPATFYGGPGFAAMQGLYEGLIEYKEGGVEIGPLIATAWTVSPDGLTYTFTLREGMTFHDGTVVDAAAVKYSFQRFIDFASSPSYMLATVKSMDAVNATTFVITLSAVTEPFLHYLASFVGPKVLSPALLEANQGSDKGATYLATHDAGSGPYTMTAAPADQGYTLTAFDGYWGTAPLIKTVKIAVIADVTTQALSLQKGDLDIISSQLPSNLAEKLQKDKNIVVTQFPTILKTVVWVKPTDYFAQLEARTALKKAINREIIVKAAYGLGATVSKSMYPSTMPGGTEVSDAYTYDPSVLTAYVKKHSAPSLVIGYLGGAASDQLAAQLMQTQLQAAGLTATVRSYGLEIFGFPADASKAPDLLVLSTNSDAADPATFIHEYLASDGPLTLNAAKNPDADAILAEGVAATSTEAATAKYVEAAKAYGDSGDFFTLADLKTVLYSRKEVGTVTWTGANPFGPVYATTGGAG